MAKITAGNRLYLYQLLGRELGIGKQALVGRVEEVLAADGIDVWDLECDSVIELLEALEPLIRLTRFRRGNVYATVQRNEELDAILARAEAPDKSKNAPKGSKPWKRKRGAAKDPRPTKPRKRPRPEPVQDLPLETTGRPFADEAGPSPSAAPSTDAATPPADAATPPADAATPLADEASTDAAADAPEMAASSLLGGIPDKTTIASAPSEASSAATQLSHEGGIETLGMPEAQAAASDAAPDEAQPPDPPATPDATPCERDETDDHPGAPAPEAAPASTAPIHPEPSIRLTIIYDPATDAVAPRGEDVEAGGDDASLPATGSLASGKTERHDLRSQPAPTPHAQAASTPAPSPASTPAPSPASAPAPSPASAPAPSPAPRTEALSAMSKLPQSFSQDVLCRDAPLSLLYRLLPPEIDPMTVLDEDWRIARSTGTLSGTRGKVSFPLRFIREDGSGNVEVTMRRNTRATSDKQWMLVLVDGDDGTGSSHESIALEGLPREDEGAWADLALVSPTQAGPTRELAQFVSLGTWDAFLGALVALAEPERWNYPGEGVGQASRYGILRDYLAVTLARVRAQDRLVESADGSFAAFNTGLLTPFAQDIHACLARQKSDIPWRFVGYTAFGVGELGMRMAEALGREPEPASYFGSLSDLVTTRGGLTVIDTETIMTRQVGRLPQAFLAEQLGASESAEAALDTLLAAQTPHDRLRAQRDFARILRGEPGLFRRVSRALDDALDLTLHRCRASYRLLAPAYDPFAQRTVLLAPLCLVDDARVDCAAVLVAGSGSTLRMPGIISLPRAYACARVISKEQPYWLEPSRVLR